MTLINLPPANAIPAALAPLDDWVCKYIHGYVAKQREAYPDYDQNHYNPEASMEQYNKVVSRYVESWWAVNELLLAINDGWEQKMGHHSPVLPKTIETIQTIEDVYIKLNEKVTRHGVDTPIPYFDENDSEEVLERNAATFLQVWVSTLPCWHI